MSFIVLSPGWKEEEDAEYGGAHEGNWTVAAQHQAAAQREGCSAERSGQSKRLISITTISF